MIERIITHCAACGRLLGTMTGDDGWFWHTGSPARIVNRRRRICEISHPNDAPTADFANYRTRTIEVVKETLEREPSEPGHPRGRLLTERRYYVWEYPYVCDDDACMDALGAEWQPTTNGSEPKFTLMPAGRVLS